MKKRRNVSESEDRNFTDSNNYLWEDPLKHARDQDEALKLCLEIQDFCCHPLPNAQVGDNKNLEFSRQPLRKRKITMKSRTLLARAPKCRRRLATSLRGHSLHDITQTIGLSHLSDRSPCHENTDIEIPSWMPSQE